MNVRYQVFISSTFRDFESERKILTQALLKIDCFPAGMEWFPAADEEQFNYIKQVIDASDYYVLVLGGLYGTIAPDGKSYTEKEYDYAVSTGKKIIALVQRNPPLTETDDDRKIKFSQFRKKVVNGRLVSLWNNTEELSTNMVTSLTHAIGKYPAQGWIRCNSEDCDARLPFVGMNSAIDSLNLDKVKTIHIMASGTLSYINVARKLLSFNSDRDAEVDVYVYFRLGFNAGRAELLRNRYSHWWNSLTTEYPTVRLHFMCQDDFKNSFRGVVVNQEVGAVGFYIRSGDTTLGNLDDCIFVDRTTDVGTYILGCFLKCFQEQPEYPTLGDCVNQTISCRANAAVQNELSNR